MVAAFPKIFVCPYHFLTHLKSIFVTGISWKFTQVKRMPTWLTFVRSEEDDPLGLLPSTLSLHDHSLWGLSSHLLLLGRIPISKWGLRPNTKVQAFAPTIWNYKKKIIFFFIFPKNKFNYMNGSQNLDIEFDKFEK